MRITLLFVLLAATTAVINAQDASYDKFKDRTTVSTDVLAVKPTRHVGASVQLSTVMVFRGQERKDNAEFYFRLRSASRDWLGSHRLIILADSEKFDLGNIDRVDSDINASRLGVSVAETFGCFIPTQVLEKIAKAETVEIQLGPFEGKLQDKSVRQIKSLWEYK